MTLPNNRYVSVRFKQISLLLIFYDFPTMKYTILIQAQFFLHRRGVMTGDGVHNCVILAYKYFFLFFLSERDNIKQFFEAKLEVLYL